MTMHAAVTLTPPPSHEPATAAAPGSPVGVDGASPGYKKFADKVKALAQVCADSWVGEGSNVSRTAVSRTAVCQRGGTAQAAWLSVPHTMVVFTSTGPRAAEPGRLGWQSNGWLSMSAHSCLVSRAHMNLT